ncbi:MAG: DNA polymerase I [Defluviitaleaceae bacterium]|nr:DNA polymerase I [Defluviitaleaceae bacterium]
MAQTPKKILLIDGFSILNRAFYALPPLSNKEGEYTNAVFGFMNIFFRFCDEENPDYITVAFDLPQPTFRHEAYGAYKGTRKGMPDELRAQVPTLKNLLEKMHINIAECAGFEADDVIGTLAAKAEAEGIEPVIISGDRDLLQLATDTVKIRLPKTKAGKTEVEDYYAADVLAKYGVSPQAFIDVKALMGDTSDNVPGVPGIGEVTATKIITAYGSLDNAIAHVGEIKPKKAAENLAEFEDQARVSKMLVTIVQDVPVELCLVPPQDMWNPDAQAEIRRLELKTLIKRFESKETGQTAPARELTYHIIKDQVGAAAFFEKLKNTGEAAAFYPLWDDTTLVGLALATASDITYIATDSGELSLFSEPGLSQEELLAAAKPWLESVAPKCVYDYKSEARRLYTYGITLGGIALDTMLAAYIIDPLAANRSPADIAGIYLQEMLPVPDDILDNKGKRGKDRKALRDVPVETAAQYAAAIADALLRVKHILEETLTAHGQTDLYHQIEMPVAATLLDMEVTGMKVDRDILQSYGDVLNTRILQLTTAIYDLAGEEFNINSPAQLGVILFEKLGLKGGKKTTQGYSTAADVLDKLADKHPIIPLVLEYRAHAKLKSTYVDGLLPLINPVTSRIYSTFNQALTATGRLSSAEPNLQNIPIRMPLGRELRKAFVPREGAVFVDADYSQIELRLLAHMSGDETLINAFREGQDIHRLTASQVLGIDPEKVTPEERSNAKAVNFGIVYGIGAYSLSEDLNISVKEADAYIAGYFAKYPGVKRYIDNTVETAKTSGYVATLFNRRRPMPELKSPNFNTRAFGERVAMNMPIQGSAADIIKIAMINTTRRLQAEKLEAKLILQVHDELLLEVPQAEVEKVTHILQEEMENAVQLDVPLVADVHVGDSWYDTK